MKYKLIEYIYEESNHHCLSELRDAEVLRSYMDMIIIIPEEAFTLEDWKYTYHYITGSKVKADTIQDVKIALRNWVLHSQNI